jgi:hypothetical protein
MDIEIEVVGDIVERQELLNGTQIVTLEGASGDGAWTMSGSLSWNIGLADTPPEGDITFVRDDGGEVFASLFSGVVSEGAESAEEEFAMNLTYEIDGVAGAFEGAAGVIELRGGLAGERFHAHASVQL